MVCTDKWQMIIKKISRISIKETCNVKQVLSGQNNFVFCSGTRLGSTQFY